MKRRLNGEGTVYEDKARNRFVGQYFDAAGKRRKVTATTETGAHKALRAATKAVDAGEAIAPARLTVGAWLTTWLEVCEARTRPGGSGTMLVAETVDGYAEIVKLHLIPALGHKPLGKLQYEDVTAALAEIAAKPKVGPSRVRSCYKVLRTALNAAVKARKVPYNVAALVETPSGSGFEADPWSSDEAMAFIDAVEGDWLAPLYAFHIGAGTRAGEARGLRFEDIKGLDTDTPVVTISHQRTRRGEDRATKSKEKGTRTFRLTALAAWALRAQINQRRTAGIIDTGFVFCQRDGKALDWRSVSRSFVMAQRRAGVRHQRLHDLRHAFTTIMLDAGEELAVISKMLGHADLSTTADMYAHLTDRQTVAAADKFNTLVRAPRLRVVNSG